MLSTALFRILRQFPNEILILFVQMSHYLVCYKQVINVKLPVENYQRPWVLFREWLRFYERHDLQWGNWECTNSDKI